VDSCNAISEHTQHSRIEIIRQLGQLAKGRPTKTSLLKIVILREEIKFETEGKGEHFVGKKEAPQYSVQLDTLHLNRNYRSTGKIGPLVQDT